MTDNPVYKLRAWQDERGYMPNDSRFCQKVTDTALMATMPISLASQAYLDSIGLTMDKYN